MPISVTCARSGNWVFSGYRFRRDPQDEARWQRDFGALLQTDNDRLAGWIRHAISIYARQVGVLRNEAAEYLCGRVPIVPLVAQRGTAVGQIAFQVPTKVSFDGQAEATRTIRDWVRSRKIEPERRFAVYRSIPGTRLVRFVGT